jgi:HlyD family secretion protein
MSVTMKSHLKPIVAVCIPLFLALILFARQAGANPLNTDAKAPLTLSGTLEARQTRIAPEVAARVNAVRVNKGDQVKVGDPLVKLDDAMLQSSLSEAESAARAALANLDQVKEPARSGAVALAEAGVVQAQAELKAAQAALDDANRSLQSPQDLQTQVHIWEGNLEASQGEVGQAEAVLAGIKNQVELAQRDQSMGGKYAYAALQKQQAAAEATLAAAQANQAGNVHVLDLYRQILKNPLDLIAAQHAAANQVKVAEAGLQVAQTELDIVRRPPQPEAVALAEAKLNAAQSNLKLVQAQGKRYSITSPLDGTVVDRTIEPGETTRPGTAVLTIADTNELELTVFVPIRNLNAVRVGQPAAIRVPSLPGSTFAGKVTYIASEGEFKPANIYNSQERSEMVFSVKVTVRNDKQNLKAGLPADATLQ